MTLYTDVLVWGRSIKSCPVLGGSFFEDFTVTHSLLTYLTLCVPADGTVLTDVSLRVLSRGCRDLHYLHLAGCSRLSDKGLSEVKRLKKLSVLNIADCTRYVCMLVLADQELYI